MKYFLKSFSQDVSLERPDKALYYIVFAREDGSEFRVPVQEDTIKELTKEVFKSESKVEEEPEEDKLDTSLPEQFDEQDEPFESDSDDPVGEDEEGRELDNLEAVEPPAPSPPPKVVPKKILRRAPATEEEIPSL